MVAQVSFGGSALLHPDLAYRLVQRRVAEHVVVLLKRSRPEPCTNLALVLAPDAVVPTGLTHPCEELRARPAIALGALVTSGVPIAGEDESAAPDERNEPGEDRVVEPRSLDGAPELRWVAAAQNVALGSAWRGVDAGHERLRTVGQQNLGEGKVVRKRVEWTALGQCERLDR